MKQIVLFQTGGPDCLKYQEAEIPVPSKNQILVKVDHAGVAFADVMMRHGKYPAMPDLPFTPGYDICGTIEQTGSAVYNLKTGDKVTALTQFGGYSQYVTVDHRRAIKVPDNINTIEGTALGLNYISAHQMLTRYKNLKPGNVILVHSAAGGVGTAILQIARTMGLKTYGTCSTNKTEIVKQNGGIAIDYRNNDFVKIMKEYEPEGVDMVLDPVGGKHWLKSWEVLKKGGGVLAGYGFFSMFNKDKTTGSFIDTGKAMIPLFLSSLIPGNKKFKLYSIKPDNFKEIQNSLETVFELYARGKLKPVIFKEYSLENAAKAHIDIANSISYGKIVLNCK